MQLNQRWADAYLYLGVALLRSDRLDEAEAAFQRELTLNRGIARSHPYLGFCNLRQGKLAGAALHAAAFLRQEPDSAKAHYLTAWSARPAASVPRQRLPTAAR